jgi:hypothetical protein
MTSKTHSLKTCETVWVDRCLRAADYIGSIQSLGALLTFKFDRFALIEGLVSRVLNCGKVYEDIFSGRPLDKAITFCAIKPLDYATLFHRDSSCFNCPVRSLFPPETAKATDLAPGANTGS